MNDDELILKDLGEIVDETRKELVNYRREDIQLNDEFKKAFSDCISNGGNSLEFEKATAVITNSAGQKIFAPNQWFVLAAYAVPLTEEVMHYRRFTEKYIDKNIDSLKSIAKIKEKKDVYQLLRSSDDVSPEREELIEKLKKAFVDDFISEGADESIAKKNTNYLIRFLTDSKWWLGGKGIERTNDYYVSPALGVLNLVNASQSYVATMTYLYITEKQLYQKIDMIVAPDGQIIEQEGEDPEERNKRLFKYWMGMQVKPEGDSDAGNPYSPVSIEQYVTNISNTPAPSVEGKSLFVTTDVGEVKYTIDVIDSSEKKNGVQRSALIKYLQYVQMLDNDYEDIFNHELFGMHIKEKNDALSEDHPHVCIGWSEMGDISQIDSKEKLSELYEEHYEKNSRGRGQDVGQIWRFLRDMKVGDYVIYAENSVFHIGRVESDYYYDETETEDQDSDYKSNRKVKWLKKNISRSVLSTNLHNSLKTAMSIWTLNDYKSAVLDLLRGTYAKDGDIEMASEYIEPVYNTKLTTKYERNRIVFGAPGTGKSFGLKINCEDLMNGTEGTYERVTFHPDYTYSQFVGTYKPVMDADGTSIRYDFVPGPFMRVYVEAIKSGRTDTPQPHLLLIEEINRAKVAAVFGDVFQLLDRDDDGVSEYEIQASEDIRRYLAKELGGVPDNYKKIRIPNNMFIWATMNSADQGVFPMDTAFKRRWNFEYLGINESEEEIIGIGKIVLPGETEAVEWNTVRRVINDRMASEYRINEDKLMGPFFLAKKVIASDENGMIIEPDKFMEAFKSKVIMYLYEDAVKQRKHDFFNGCDSSKYSSVCDAFDEKGIAIFGASVKNTVYNK